MASSTDVAESGDSGLLDLFCAALALSGSARSAWLDNLKQSCPDAHARLIRLLSYDELADATDFLPYVDAAPHSSVEQNPDLEDVAFPSGTTETHVDSLKSPQIPGYRIVGVLGRGGMGVVYKAKQTRLDRFVAIKLPNATRNLLAADSQAVMAEARLVASLDHPNIVPVYDVETSADIPCYIVSKYVEGMDLGRFARSHPLDCGQIALLVASIAETLHYAHSRGVYHRDIKPGNILIDRAQVAHLLDFGLAQRETDVGTGPRFAGTPAYMSPEQARGEGDQVDGRCDIFSLGVVLYELLTGVRPFRARLRPDLLAQILEEDPVPPRQIAARVPAALERACLKALAKQPADRYATAREFSEDLKQFAREFELHTDLEVDDPEARLSATDQTESSASALVTRIDSESDFLDSRRMTALSKNRQRIKYAGIIGLLVAIGGFGLTAPESRPRVTSDQPPTGPAAASDATALSHLNDSEETLHQRYRGSSDFEERLNLATQVTHATDDELAFLVDAIPQARPATCAAIVSALQRRAKHALLLLSPKFREKGSSASEAQARFALTSLYLGNADAVASACRPADDPSERTMLIHTLPTWLTAPAAIARALESSSDGDLRSGLCAALGMVAPFDVDKADRQRLTELLKETYQAAPDSGSHSAAAWALRRWGEPLPPLAAEPGPAEKRDWFVNQHGLTMHKLPAGEFTMGLRKGSHGRMAQMESCRHEVTIPADFAISSTEVTVELFTQFIQDAKPSLREVPHGWVWPDGLPRISPSPDCPMQNIEWYDAVRFCNWLSRREGRTPCYTQTERMSRYREPGFRYWWSVLWVWNHNADGYRLPTEEEWEYACRAGSKTDFNFGNERDAASIGDYAVLSSDRSRPVAERLPNPWGLFDMHGNVSEWCWDGSRQYSQDHFVAVAAPPGNDRAAIRGGNWGNTGREASSGFRFSMVPFSGRIHPIGLRVVCATERRSAPLPPESLVVDSIRGVKFHDLDGDGQQDDEELGFEGAPVFLDLNRNGTLDDGEPSVTTDPAGEFVFNDLPPASYAIRDVNSFPWVTRTNPQTVELQPGKTIAGLRLPTNISPSIGGTVYHDRNRNGLREEGEEPISGAAVLVKNSERRFSVNFRGEYSFWVSPGPVAFKVSLPEGYRPTTPPDGTHAFLAVSAESQIGFDFGAVAQP